MDRSAAASRQSAAGPATAGFPRIAALCRDAATGTRLMGRAGIWPARKSGTATRRPSVFGMCLVGCSSPEFSSVYEARAQARECFGAVAQLVFHLLAQLGERLLITVGNEERIVPKAALPLRRKADVPFTYAFE